MSDKPDLSNDYTEFEQGNDGDWRWHRRAGNNRNLAVPGEGFSSRDAAERNYERTRASFVYDDAAAVLPIAAVIPLLFVCLLAAFGGGWVAHSTPKEETRVERTTTTATVTSTPSTAASVEPTTTPPTSTPATAVVVPPTPLATATSTPSSAASPLGPDRMPRTF